MNRILSLLPMLMCFSLWVNAQKTNSPNYSTGIVSNNSTHIARITQDTLVMISGTTYLFTVDTPADKGLVSTTPVLSQLLDQITSKDGSVQKYRVIGREGAFKTEGGIESGDHLEVTSQDGKNKKTYIIAFQPMAIGGQLRLDKKEVTASTTQELTIFFTAGQRSPNTTVRFTLPEGVNVTPDNTTVNVIGRGDVKLKDLATQSMGRLGSNYTYKKVGNFGVYKIAEGGSSLLFKHLDLRPSNGPDLKIVISGVSLKQAGTYAFKVFYSTTKPEVLTSPGIGAETATLTVTNSISDFERIVDRNLQYQETPDTYTKATFKWASGITASHLQLMQSLDDGKHWTPAKATIDTKSSTASVSGLQRDKLYTFSLLAKDGEHKGYSNRVRFFSGKMDVKTFGIVGDGKQDNTGKINEAIEYLHQMGGGTLLFSEGVYNVRTVHLKSNVYLYVEKGATIKALRGGDAPESTWFSDRKYRSGLSPTASGPYDEPENWLTKQDVGHHYFQNSMFFGERLDNVKIIGNGLITGNGNLVNSDGVMNNTADNRTDKMFTLKLCTNVEIGGVYKKADLWYDEEKDVPIYFNPDGSKNFDTDNMLQIERTGHFALLATGTDGLNVHDTYFGKYNQNNVRDIYDFMACNDVTVTNIFCKVSSDDIVKPGSDCSLGFTRPARNYKVRNIIGDTNCNLFQIGSETADDITDLWVDNIYVLGANKAGFSISTNDGAHIKNVYLNSGKTGSVHSRSRMFRTTTPFFISISNRGRILGANVAKYKFDDNGEAHDELLVTNVNIGEVENININGVDVSEVYSGSSYSGKTRWKPYDGSQKKSTAIVAGYALPDSSAVVGGLNFRLPNGKHTGYIKDITFNDVHITYKGGNPVTDTAARPPELGVGQYNVGNLKVQPSYGLWARHVNGLTVKDCSFNYEKTDSRYALFLDDVIGGTISKVKAVRAIDNTEVIKLKNSSGVTTDNVVYFKNEWGVAPAMLK
ncbi:MAG: endopygalactorunase [Bacteroidota bacterium]|nr:endopygalactorunase [Bacteroidota bacterium]